MNGHRAKSIRRAVYGDQSSKVTGRQYTVKDIGHRIIRFLVRDGKVMKERQFFADRSIVKSVGLRRQYQQAKADYKRSRNRSRVMPTAV